MLVTRWLEVGFEECGLSTCSTVNRSVSDVVRHRVLTYGNPTNNTISLLLDVGRSGEDVGVTGGTNSA